jgi:hypothetical membrane protein
MTSPSLTTRGTRITTGAFLWIAGAVIFFACHFIAQSAWSHPAYSWMANNISDLGNVHCGQWGDNHRYVCSPRHVLMNVGFIATGLLLFTGTLLAAPLWSSSRVTKGLLLAASLAFALVGLAPADVNLGFHLLAVPFIFLGGNLGIITTGVLWRGTPLRLAGFLGTLLGVAGLIATYLFFTNNFLILGMGGMERFGALPMPVCMAVAGTYILLRRLRFSEI